MKRIHTFSGQPALRQHTVADIIAIKGSGHKLTMVNPTSEEEAKAAVEAGIEVFGIWDRELEAIRSVAPHTFIASSMAYEAYASKDDILRAALDSLAGGADCFYTNRSLEVIEMLAKESVPVQSHMGLIPRFSTWQGGLRAIGRTAKEAKEIYCQFKRLENAGCFCVEIECVAEDALALLNERTSIVTMSLGSGSAGDIISMFVADICGESSNPPKHAKAFGNLRRLHEQMYQGRVAALKAFRHAAIEGDYPEPAQVVSMRSGEREELMEYLDKQE